MSERAFIAQRGRRIREKGGEVLAKHCSETGGGDILSYRAFCGICGQKWDLRGKPVEGCQGRVEVWKARRRYVEKRKNGKGAVSTLAI